jgi:hypothetical protein
MGTRTQRYILQQIEIISLKNSKNFRGVLFQAATIVFLPHEILIRNWTEKGGSTVYDIRRIFVNFCSP